MHWETRGEFEMHVQPFYAAVRERILTARPLPEKFSLRLSLRDWASCEVLVLILNMFAEQHRTQLLTASIILPPRL